MRQLVVAFRGLTDAAPRTGRLDHERDPIDQGAVIGRRTEQEMGLKDILVYLDAGPASADLLRLAVTLARQHGAELSAAFLEDGAAAEHGHAGTLPVELAMAFSDTAASRRGAAPGEDQEQQFRTCQQQLRGQGGWHHVERGDTAHLIELSRTPDLVVMGQISPYARRSPWWRAADVIIGCGRPILLVPYAGSYREVGHRVLIGWDDSREATRAVHDALPIIGEATAVTVMTVRTSRAVTQHDQAASKRLIQYLARHGITARADHALCSGTSVCDVLLSSATELAADLIVAGGYHRAPWREAMAGGVSRALLHSMTVPILMSH